MEGDPLISCFTEVQPPPCSGQPHLIEIQSQKGEVFPTHIHIPFEKVVNKDAAPSQVNKVLM